MEFMTILRKMLISINKIKYNLVIGINKLIMSDMDKDTEQVGDHSLLSRLKNNPVLLGKGNTKLTAYLSYDGAILPCKYVCKRKTTKPYKYLLII